jgi:hypothetical protein
VPGGNNTDNNIVVAPVDNSSTASNNNNNPNSLTNRGLSSDRSQNGEIDYRKVLFYSSLQNIYFLLYQDSDIGNIIYFLI